MEIYMPKLNLLIILQLLLFMIMPKFFVNLLVLLHLPLFLIMPEPLVNMLIFHLPHLWSCQQHLWSICSSFSFCFSDHAKTIWLLGHLAASAFVMHAGTMWVIRSSCSFCTSDHVKTFLSNCTSCSSCISDHAKIFLSICSSSCSFCFYDHAKAFWSIWLSLSFRTCRRLIMLKPFLLHRQFVENFVLLLTLSFIPQTCIHRFASIFWWWSLNLEIVQKPEAWSLRLYRSLNFGMVQKLEAWHCTKAWSLKL